MAGEGVGWGGKTVFFSVVVVGGGGGGETRSKMMI